MAVKKLRRREVRCGKNAIRSIPLYTRGGGYIIIYWAGIASISNRAGFF